MHPGVGAELDLVVGLRDGRAASWTWRSVAPEQPPALQVRGRTGSGDVLVARAAVPA